MGIILEQLAKRRAYPVPELGEGVFVRSMARSELIVLRNKRRQEADKDAARNKAIEAGEPHPLEDETDDESTDYMLGCVLCDKDGKQAIPREPDESVESYCERVRGLTPELTLEAISRITATVNKIGQIPSAETLEGN